MKTTVNNVTTKGRSILLMLLLLVPMLAMAQEYPSKDKLIPVDEMRLKVQYNVDFHYSKEKPEKVKRDVMYTEIGNKAIAAKVNLKLQKLLCLWNLFTSDDLSY